MHTELAELITPESTKLLVFQDVVSTIRRHYVCSPVAFDTGVGTSRHTVNAAGSNAASCLLLAFARRLGLSEQQTLALYAEHYRSVLEDPQGGAHANIRAFMANGWAGVRFADDPLRLRGPA